MFGNPAFWTVLLHSADVAVEKASPDYTVAHHIASVLDGILGYQPISTPNAAAATPVGTAILGAGMQVATGTLGGK